MQTIRLTITLVLFCNLLIWYDYLELVFLFDHRHLTVWDIPVNDFHPVFPYCQLGVVTRSVFGMYEQVHGNFSHQYVAEALALVAFDEGPFGEVLAAECHQTVVCT